MIYADYNYYVLDYRGTAVTAEDFDRLAVRASTFIDYYTMGRAGAKADTDAVKMCCCALCDAYAGLDTVSADASVQSESVGSYSRTFRAKDELVNSTRAELARTAQMYLAPTGLLYRGGC